MEGLLLQIMMEDPRLYILIGIALNGKHPSHQQKELISNGYISLFSCLFFFFFAKNKSKWGFICIANFGPDDSLLGQSEVFQKFVLPPEFLFY